MRTFLGIIAVAALGLSAGPAAAQGPVDLQLNLSTQPVYGGYKAPSSSYFGSGDLYATGNIRGGRALMINRTFLDDRFFSGSMTRFFRDTVSASDVTAPGYTDTAGQPQAYFRPGSLVTSGSTVGRTPVTGGLSPFGLSFNPSAALASPFSVTSAQPVEQQTPSMAEFPASAVLRTRELLTETPPAAAPPTKAPLWNQPTPEPGDQRLPAAPTTESMFAPKAPGEGPAAEAARPTVSPDGQTPQVAPPVQGLRPMDYLRERFGEQAVEPRKAETRPAETPSETKPNLGPAPGGGEEAVAPPLKLPEIQAIPGGRPQRFYEQYMAMGIEELKAGAYRPASDAFSKAADFNPLDAWQARSHEAVARLLAREYLVASFQLGSVIQARPAAFVKGGPAAALANRPADWKSVEDDLRQILRETPKASDHAFCLAYVLIVGGRAAEAEPLLATAAADGTYADAVKVLRQALKP